MLEEKLHRQYAIITVLKLGISRMKKNVAKLHDPSVGEDMEKPEDNKAPSTLIEELELNNIILRNLADEIEDLSATLDTIINKEVAEQSESANTDSESY